MCERSDFALCPQCKNRPLKVKPTKFDTVFISCAGYPMCKNSMDLPRGITEVDMQEILCQKCLKNRKRECKMFRLTFDREIINESMAEALPDNNNTSGLFCVFQGCDDNLFTLKSNTKNINMKRTNNQNNNNDNPNMVHAGQYHNTKVPNYYYTKPENNDLIQKVPKAPKVAGKPTSNRDGCELCGKKRHVKASTCANNKNKQAE